MRHHAIAILGLVMFVACSDDDPPASGPPVNLRPISVRIAGPAQVTLPAEVQFTALQMWSDGSTRDVTARAQWTSSNSSVLSVSGGLARTLASGEAGLTAQVEQLISQPKAVRVVPLKPEWEGTYTLTIGGGPCNESQPLPHELRQRSYTATLQQNGLTLTGTVSNVGGFEGRIINPEARFTLYRARSLSRRVRKASITGMLPFSNARVESAVARHEPRLHMPTVRRAAYSGTEPEFVEVLGARRLVIYGQAVTTMSPSGFAGILDGALALHEPAEGFIGVCASSSHGFTLVRR